MLLNFIFKFFKFLIVAIVVYAGFIIFWGSYAPEYLKINIQHPTSGYLEDRINDIKNYDKVDVLVIGASNVYRGVDTRFFRKEGIDIFNLGSNSQTPEQSLILLRQYLDSLRPQLVILDVYPSNFEKDGVESMLDLISNGCIDKDVIAYVIKNPNIKLINALIYNGIFQMFDLEASVKRESVIENKSAYISGGYVEYKAERNNYIKPFPESNWNLRTDQLKALNEIIQFLEYRKTPLLLIRMPLANYKYKSFKNNAEIDSIFSKKAKFYNFQNKVQLSDSLDFLDGTHMSQSGVLKFNGVLLEYLKNNDLLNFSETVKEGPL